MSWIRFGKIALVLLAMGTAAGVHADVIWIDVRSPLEHSIDSIDQDAFISHKRIVAGVSKTFPDKDADIRLYCLSGGRAEKSGGRK
jgi:phage shock protein E